jgi:hypothetical protein
LTDARHRHVRYLRTGDARGRLARGEPDRRDHRQSEREERGKGGSAIDAGCDAGKKIKGKKRHVLVDTQGLLMHALVHAGDVRTGTAGRW